ncbi:MAG: hypothetical protein E7454_05685 [Ruminococcaceae bacterium]|nr:hypothetical protein [Oscillospiraceae bacterium]
MKQSSFTAKELFAMAYLLRKPKMYGIPNVMGADRNVSLQVVLDELVSQGVADMDMDGHISLRPEYYTMVNGFCDCQKCLTVNARYNEASMQNIIFWLYDDSWIMSEVIDDRYVFSQADADTIRAIVNNSFCTAEMQELKPEVVIPQVQIGKAKRACLKGNFVEAFRMIRQYGADSDTSSTIVAGLQGSSYYLGLVYMDMQSGACQKQDCSFLYSDSVLLSLDQTVANFRTCATFTPITCADMRHKVNSLLDSFLTKGA